MERELPKPVAAFSSDNTATLDRLVAMLDYAEGLTILFACCNTPMLRDRLIEQACVRLAVLGVAVISLDFDQPVRNLRQTLRARLAIPPAHSAAADEPGRAAALHEPASAYASAPKLVVFLTGLELSIPLGASAARLMAELNLGRELFLRDAPCPLVFWLPDYAVTAVARHAPDFWAWRSGVFEFTLEEPHRREAYARYIELDGNLAALSNLTAARKLQRQRILEGLLDDFQALPPQRATQEQLAEIQQELAALQWLQGKPQEAMALYQESLATIQALGDVREIAVTQSSMADVLSQMGKPQEAMALYQESLATIQALGDVRSIAATQANFGQFLLQEGKTSAAIEMLWSAYLTLDGAGYEADAVTMRNLLAAVKTQVLGAARFDTSWAETVGGEQPAWLAAVAPPIPYHLPPDQQAMLAANTVAVLTTAPDKRAEWRNVVADASARMASSGIGDLAALNNAILALLDSQPADLRADNAYHALWQKILNGVAQGGLPDEDEEADLEVAQRMAAINAFVGANNWAASRRVVEEQKKILLTAAAEQIFLENIARARTSGDSRSSAYLQQHLDLLLACRRIGIDAAFDALEAEATVVDNEEGIQTLC